MNLVIPDIKEIVLVTNGQRATVYLRQDPTMPSVTIAFDSPVLARKYIRSLGVPRTGGKRCFTERDLITGSDKKMRL